MLRVCFVSHHLIFPSQQMVPLMTQKTSQVLVLLHPIWPQLIRERSLYTCTYTSTVLYGNCRNSSMEYLRTGYSSSHAPATPLSCNEKYLTHTSLERTVDLPQLEARRVQARHLLHHRPPHHRAALPQRLRRLLHVAHPRHHRRVGPRGQPLEDAPARLPGGARDDHRGRRRRRGGTGAGRQYTAVSRRVDVCRQCRGHNVDCYVGVCRRERKGE